jgi:hypothetical protein
MSPPPWHNAATHARKLAALAHVRTLSVTHSRHIAGLVLVNTRLFPRLHTLTFPPATHIWAWKRRRPRSGLFALLEREAPREVIVGGRPAGSREVFPDINLPALYRAWEGAGHAPVVTVRVLPPHAGATDGVALGEDDNLFDLVDDLLDEGAMAIMHACLPFRLVDVPEMYEGHREAYAAGMFHIRTMWRFVEYTADTEPPPVEMPWGPDEPWWSPDLAAAVAELYPDEVGVAERMRERDETLCSRLAMPRDIAEELQWQVRHFEHLRPFCLRRVREVAVRDMLRDARRLLGIGEPGTLDPSKSGHESGNQP